MNFSKFNGFRIFQNLAVFSSASPWSLHFGTVISQAPSCRQNSHTTHLWAFLKWRSRFLWVFKVTSHKLHWNWSSLECSLMWKFKLYTVVNLLSSQPGSIHLKSFNPWWLCWCLFNRTMVGNDQLQPSCVHLNGLTFLWLKMCSFNWDRLVNTLWQLSSGQCQFNLMEI